MATGSTTSSRSSRSELGELAGDQASRRAFSCRRRWWTVQKQDIARLVVCGAAVTVAALGGSLAAIDAADQYAALDQPSWAPPSWLFGPVWTALFIAIAVAGWRLWRGGASSPGFIGWCVQLAMNALWTPLFFAWELRGLALVWILAMDAIVTWLVWRSWRRDRVVAYLLLPYLAWILFASCLNAAVWLLNRT